MFEVVLDVFDFARWGFEGFGEKRFVWEVLEDEGCEDVPVSEAIFESCN